MLLVWGQPATHREEPATGGEAMRPNVDHELARRLREHVARASIVGVVRDLQESAADGMYCPLSSKAYRERCRTEHEAWSVLLELLGEKS